MLARISAGRARGSSGHSERRGLARRAALLAVATSLGCAAEGGPCPVASPIRATEVEVPVAEVPAAAEPAPVAPSTLSPCYPDGRPAPPPVARGVPFCAALDMYEVARVEARIRSAFVVHARPSKLVIDFGCDEAYAAPRALVYEEASGHGDSLFVTRLERSLDHYSVRRITVRAYRPKRLAIEAGSAPASAVDALIARARVAMLARPHLVTLFDPAGGGSGEGTAAWSNAFHLFLGVVDEGGRMTAGGYTGYETDDAQGHILPMRLATEPLVKLLAGVAFSEVEAIDEDRVFFTKRLVSTLGHDPATWVRERYLEGASELGTRDAVPALVAQITAPVAEGRLTDARSRDRAVEALVALTGWDPRVDAGGDARPIAETVAEVTRLCGSN